MDAKKLLKKHLAIHIPKGVYISEKQLAQATYEATIDALNEALEISQIKQYESEDYLETYYEMVSIILALEENDETIVSKVRQEKGQGGLYELAQKWTTEFIAKHKDIVWGEELEYFDELEKFIDEKNK